MGERKSLTVDIPIAVNSDGAWMAKAWNNGDGQDVELNTKAAKDFFVDSETVQVVMVRVEIPVIETLEEVPDNRMCAAEIMG